MTTSPARRAFRIHEAPDLMLVRAMRLLKAENRVAGRRNRAMIRVQDELERRGLAAACQYHPFNAY